MHGPERTKRIEIFPQCDLVVLELHVTRRHVVENRIPGKTIHHLVFGNLLHGATDHDRELDLIIELIRLRGLTIGAPGPMTARRQLREEKRLRRHRGVRDSPPCDRDN